MSIIRIIAVDPSPREGNGDILVYQVPEHSRTLELLTDLFTKEGIEWVAINPPKATTRAGGSRRMKKGDTK